MMARFFFQFFIRDSFESFFMPWDGIPSMVRSDSGSQYTSAEFQNNMEL